MADVSWRDRKRIIRTIKDAYDPTMRDSFPASTPEIATHSNNEPTCPPGVDKVRLDIQCVLLPFFDHPEFHIFCRLQAGEKLGDLARAHNVDRRELRRLIDEMLDRAILRMRWGTVSMILAIYWEMHQEEDWCIHSYK